MYNDDAIYYHGVSRGMYYPRNGTGEAWPGISAIDSEETERSQKIIFVDGEGQVLSFTETDFEAVISCYTFPDEVDESIFDFAYRVERGDTGYELHLVYGCTASLDSQDWYTIEDDPDAAQFTVSISTMPPNSSVPGLTLRSHLIIRSTDLYENALSGLEDILYGTDDEEPRMPSQDELVEFLESWAILRIIDHGDGTWTAIGPDDAVKMISATEFQISWPSAKIIDLDSYIVSSL